MTTSNPPAVLMFADTTHTAAMRNEVPHSVHDPFLYIEQGDKRYTVLRSLEVARMSEVERMTAWPQEEFGLDELLASGLSGEQATLEIALRACQRLGITAAVVGVILNLALFFAYHLLWPQGWGGPFDAVSAVIALAAVVALFRFKLGVMPLLGLCAAVGLVATFLKPWMA